MSTEAAKLVEESDPRVIKITTGKRRLSVMGLVSVYRLSNGWIAVRQRPESTWSRSAYWNIFATEADRTAHRSLGGGEQRLTRAIANVLNFG